MKNDDPRFRLGEWIIDPATGEISSGPESSRLEPKVMEVLVCLVAAEGRVVSKQEVFETVWGEVAVTDDVLRRCLYNLRQALGDDSENPRYVRTLPRRGYQLVAEVRDVETADETDAEPAVEEPGPRVPQIPPAPEHVVVAEPRRGWRRFAAMAIVGIAAVVAVIISTGATPEDITEQTAELLLSEGQPNPTTAQEFYDLGKHHADRRGPEDFERSIELFTKALDIDPGHAGAHAEIANVYALSVRGYFADNSRFDLAIEHATIALGLDPDSAEAHKALGIAYTGKGWLDSAAREYERSLEKRDNYQAVINNLAIVETARGRPDRALGLQQQLESTATRRGLHLNNIGHTYRLLLDYPAARRAFEASLEADPENALASSNLALLELSEGNTEEAIKRIHAAVPHAPDDARFMASAGLIELAAGDLEHAEELFRASANLSAYGTNNIAWLGIAYLHLQRDELEAVEEIFPSFFDYSEESRRMRRENWGPHFNLTAIYSMTGRIDEALASYEQAIAHGHVDFRYIDTVPFFEQMRADPRYDAMVSDLRRRMAKMREEAMESGAGS